MKVGNCLDCFKWLELHPCSVSPLLTLVGAMGPPGAWRVSFCVCSFFVFVCLGAVVTEAEEGN